MYEEYKHSVKFPPAAAPIYFICFIFKKSYVAHVWQQKRNFSNIKDGC